MKQVGYNVNEKEAELLKLNEYAELLPLLHNRKNLTIVEIKHKEKSFDIDYFYIEIITNNDDVYHVKCIPKNKICEVELELNMNSFIRGEAKVFVFKKFVELKRPYGYRYSVIIASETIWSKYIVTVWSGLQEDTVDLSYSFSTKAKGKLPETNDNLSNYGEFKNFSNLKKMFKV